MVARQPKWPDLSGNFTMPSQQKFSKDPLIWIFDFSPDQAKSSVRNAKHSQTLDHPCGLARRAPRHAACLKAAVLLILPSRVLLPSSNIGLSERVVEDLSVFVYRWLRRYKSDRAPSDCTESSNMTACLSANSMDIFCRRCDHVIGNLFLPCKFSTVSIS